MELPVRGREPGTLFLYLGVHGLDTFQKPVGFMGLIAVLFGCNALLGLVGLLQRSSGRWASCATRPCASAKETLTSASTPAAKEFGEVTGAFETMREKLRGAVNRQLAEETRARSSSRMSPMTSNTHQPDPRVRRGPAQMGWPPRRRCASATCRPSWIAAGELERLIEVLFSYPPWTSRACAPKLAAVEVAPYLRACEIPLQRHFPPPPSRLDGEPVVSAGLFIKADVELTRRVMSNLVENAVTHGAGRHIAISGGFRRRRAGVTLP